MRGNSGWRRWAALCTVRTGWATPGACHELSGSLCAPPPRMGVDRGVFHRGCRAVDLRRTLVEPAVAVLDGRGHGARGLGRLLLVRLSAAEPADWRGTEPL